MFLLCQWVKGINTCRSCTPECPVIEYQSLFKPELDYKLGNIWRIRPVTRYLLQPKVEYFLQCGGFSVSNVKLWSLFTCQAWRGLWLSSQGTRCFQDSNPKFCLLPGTLYLFLGTLYLFMGHYICFLRHNISFLGPYICFLRYHLCFLGHNLCFPGHYLSHNFPNLKKVFCDNISVS